MAKPIDSKRLISEYKDAYRKANGAEPTKIVYVNGWFILRSGSGFGFESRYRAADIERFTKQLKGRVSQ